MQIIQAQQRERTPNAHGVQAQMLLNTDPVQTVMITLQPGESLKSHVTPVDVFFYGLEGEGIVEIGDERASMNRDDLVHSPRDIPHRLLNENNNVFRFLVVKTPNPRMAK